MYQTRYQQPNWWSMPSPTKDFLATFSYPAGTGQWNPTFSNTADTRKWIPTTVFQIINPDYGTQTCIGHAPSQGRRCRNPINASNRSFMAAKLARLSYLSPRDPQVAGELFDIARAGLCQRWHQDQAWNIVSVWKQKIACVPFREGEYASNSGYDDDEAPMYPGIRVKKTSVKMEDDRDAMRAKMREMEEMLRNLNEQVRSYQQASTTSYGPTPSRPMRHGDDKQEKVRLQAQRAAEARQEKQRQERLEQEKLENEKFEKDKLEKGKLKREKLEKEKLEKERIEKERLEKEKLEKERLENIRLENERLEAERRRKESDSERNERIRLRAEKVRLERENTAKLAAAKARAEVDAAWSTYQDQWTSFKISLSTPMTPPSTPPSSPSRAPQPTSRSELADEIPWPVQSGRYEDVKLEMVKAFMHKFFEGRDDTDKIRLLRKECLKWHPDQFYRGLRNSGREVEMGDVDKMKVDLVCRAMTGLLNEIQGR